MTSLAILIPALAGVLVDFLWQGTVIGLLAWLALSLLRNAPPQVRYTVTCVALLACVVVPAWQLVHAVVGSGAAAQYQVFAPDENLNVASTERFDVLAFTSLPLLPSIPYGALSWIVVFWTVGAGALSLRMVCGLWWVSRLRSSSVADRDEWQGRLNALALRMGIRRTVALRIVQDGDSPLSAGWWRPVVLLPTALALRMPTHLLEALIAHELAHIRRHDYLVNLLQSVVEVMLFYHPVTWWLSRQMRVEREQVADDIAASALPAPRHLALALSRLDRYATSLPALAQAAHGGELLSRIHRLIRPTDRRTISATTALFLLGLLTIGIVVAQTKSAPLPHTPAAFVGHSGAPSGALATSAPVEIAGLVNKVAMATTEISALKALQGAEQPAHTGTVIPTHSVGPRFARIQKNRGRLPKSVEPAGIDSMGPTDIRTEGDSLSFRRNGKNYVIHDATLVKRTDAAWAPIRQHEIRIETASDVREPLQQEKLEDLGKQMDEAAIIAYRQIQGLVEEAVSDGLAIAAPGSR